jgi:hypothetical protein
MGSQAMSATVDAFFYGLYMDETVLAGAGYALKIGKRATLVQAPGSVAWGIVYALTPDDLAKLYGAPGLEVYQPQQIEVALENRAIISARVYNLAQPPAADERNPDYAEKLKAAMTRLGFPADYIARIA